MSSWSWCEMGLGPEAHSRQSWIQVCRYFVFCLLTCFVSLVNACYLQNRSTCLTVINLALFKSYSTNKVAREHSEYAELEYKLLITTGWLIGRIKMRCKGSSVMWTRGQSAHTILIAQRQIIPWRILERQAILWLFLSPYWTQASRRCSNLLIYLPLCPTWTVLISRSLLHCAIIFRFDSCTSQAEFTLLDGPCPAFLGSYNVLCVLIQ